MERYELVEGTSSKFWEVFVSGVSLKIRYGRIGTQGQSKDKDFSTAEDAEKEKKKLVKEKTGKGYLRVADGEMPAPSAPAAASPEASKDENLTTPSPAASEATTQPPVLAQPVAKPVVDADREEILSRLIGSALPTRSRRFAVTDPVKVWAKLRSYVALIKDNAQDEQLEAWNWLDAKVQEAGEAGESIGVSTAAEVREWTEKIEQASKYLTVYLGERQKKTSASLVCLDYFFEFLSAKRGMPFVVEAMLPLVGIDPSNRRGYEASSLSSPRELALRDYITAAPDQDYEAIIAMLIEASRTESDWRRKAAFAFILGDDRDVQHELTPLAFLTAAQEAGEDVGATLSMVPLVLDARPSAAARWRTKRTYFIFFMYYDLMLDDILATAIKTARHYNESALPTLEWLLHYGYEGQRTEIARVILATGESGALAKLLPFIHEKWIRPAVDQASEEDPAFMFGQYLATLSSGSNEPVIRARAMDFVKQYPKEALEGWAAEPRWKTQLQKLLDVHDVVLAPLEALPVVLHDPPWRKKKKAVDDTVLELLPLETPFRYLREGPPPEEYHWRIRNARIVSTTEELIDAIREFESKDVADWKKVPRSMAIPQKGDELEDVLAFVSRRVSEFQDYYAAGYYDWDKLIGGIEKQFDSFSLTLWGQPKVLPSYYMGDICPRMIDRFGERALPGLIRNLESDPIGMLEHVKDVDFAGIAPLAARALLKLKKARIPAMQWLRLYRRTAITRLLPDATGKPGPARDAAEHTLRWMVADRAEARDEILEVAKLYEPQSPDVMKAIWEVLDRDPYARFPARIAKLPAWFNPGTLTRPVLKDGSALPDEALAAIAEMLSFSTPEAIYAGLDAVKEITTPESLAQFSWDLFGAWLAEGAPNKEGWALRGLGWLGDDECARQLTRLVRKWPGESAHQRAVTGLDVLADIGTDVALMNLNGIAEKLKFKGLQEKAREKIAAIAEARDLTPEELADRLAPDLDLDERGGLDLDFGPRRFRVGFDEFLKPWVKDETGKRLKDLPKPNKADDAALSAASVKTWAAVKKDARAVSSIQITRLENMLSTSRRVSPEVFWLFFASHPLIRHLSQRLVWGVYDDIAPQTAPTTLFRVADDLSFTDAEDEPITLDLSAAATGLIGLVHPLHLPKGGLDAWGALFGDYEISQPFPQLGRETYELTQDEKQASTITRFADIEVEATRLRGMSTRGWNLGSVEDGGCISWLERPVRFSDGKVNTAMCGFDPGLFTGGADWEEKFQKLQSITLYRPYGQPGSDTRTFGELDPVTASEMLRGLSLLAATAVK
ncbi:DUF4132 domain-containing protein [Rhizobium sp. Leaf262]|uniref:WGR and DUF4132 domain-containing protein n=1 Tax=Rhizobium sp. Leaf262 TaxID=1736312 RepID=UPI000715A1DE|nr:DUF4132 domain-containing protein [Rhizobium sp. Leaf262]KQO83436.1 hypothetical protein ASF29_00945 [Rhizobium sp. Leaf262]